MKRKTTNLIGTLLVGTALAGTMMLPNEVNAAQENQTPKNQASNLDAQQKSNLFSDNGYRANQDIQNSLNKIWDIEGDTHRKLNRPSLGKLPSLIAEIESALGNQKTNFSKSLASTLSTTELTQARGYLREITKDKLQDAGIKNAGNHISSQTLETAGQVETNSAINPLTPPKKASYHRVSKYMPLVKKQAKIEYNLRNYISPDGIVHQGNNNFFVDLAKRESGLNPWAGTPTGDKAGCKLMFQMCNKERATFGGSSQGDWHGQRKAAEKLAHHNLEILTKLVPNLSYKVINFSNGTKFNVDDSALAGAAWLTGAPNTANFLNRKNSFSKDSLGTNPLEYMLGFAGHKVDFGQEKQQYHENQQDIASDRKAPESLARQEQGRKLTEEQSATATGYFTNKIMEILKNIRETVRPLIIDDGDKSEKRKQDSDLSLIIPASDNTTIIDRALEIQRQNSIVAIISDDNRNTRQNTTAKLETQESETKWQKRLAASTLTDSIPPEQILSDNISYVNRVSTSLKNTGKSMV